MVLVHGSAPQTDGRTFWRCGQDQGRRQKERLGLRRDGVVVGAAGRTVGLGLNDVDSTRRHGVHGHCPATARVLTAVTMSPMSLRDAARVFGQVHAHLVRADDGKHKEHDSGHGRRSVPGTGHQRAEATCQDHGGHYCNGKVTAWNHRPGRRAGSRAGPDGGRAGQTG